MEMTPAPISVERLRELIHNADPNNSESLVQLLAATICDVPALLHQLAEREAEVERLRELAGCAYQMAGVHDAPEPWLDALSDAANGTPLAEWRVQADLCETLLPYQPEAVCAAERTREECVKLAERWERISSTHGVRCFTGDDHLIYEVRKGSQSAHCCFEATVVDMSQPEMIGDKQYVGENGPQFVAVCECFDMFEAEMIAAALNAATPVSGGPRDG